MRPDYGSWVDSVADKMNAMDAMVKKFGSEAEKHALSPELQEYMNRPELKAKMKSDLDAMVGALGKLKDVYGVDIVKPLAVPIARLVVRGLMN